MKKYISIILICILGASLLVGCGRKEKVDPSLEAYAGLYTCLGYYVEEQFVVQEDLSGWSVTLKKDGTASLYWGEDNNGPISKWSIDGEKIIIHAGVSVIEGTISDSIMLLDMGDGIVLGWAGPGADFDKLNMTTIDLFLDDEPTDKENDLTVESVCNTYYPFAKIRDGYCIAMPEGTEEGRFILREDGTAQSPFGDKLSEYTWVMDGNAITFKDKSSGEIIYTGTIAGGILTLDVIYTNPDGSTFTTQDILVTKDADTSNIDTISIEEYNALPREQKNG